MELGRMLLAGPNAPQYNLARCVGLRTSAIHGVLSSTSAIFIGPTPPSLEEVPG